MLKIASPDLFGYLSEVARVSPLLVHNIEPAKPLALVPPRPEPRVLAP